MKQISRREFVTFAAASAAAPRPALYSRVFSPPLAITAQEIVDRIRQKAGGEWKADTVDTFKAGTPSTIVKGIATTAIATLEVLKQAVKGGANLVITCEPTFYSKSDAASPPSG